MKLHTADITALGQSIGCEQIKEIPQRMLSFTINQAPNSFLSNLFTVQIIVDVITGVTHHYRNPVPVVRQYFSMETSSSDFSLTIDNYACLLDGRI